MISGIAHVSLQGMRLLLVAAVIVVASFFSFYLFLSSNQANAANSGEPRIDKPNWGMQQSADSKDCYKTQLSGIELETYEVIENALRTLQPAVALDDVTPEQFEQIWRMVLFDNPDIFWVGNRYIYLPTYENGPLIGGFSYWDTDFARIKAKHARYVSEVAGIVEECREENQTQEDLLKALMDKVCSKLQYESTVNDQNVEPLFGANDGKTVCTGYAKAMKILCDAAGIDCVLMYGKSYLDDNDDGRHVWNMCRADGMVEYVEATWADTGEEASGSYCVQNGTLFVTKHYPLEASEKLPIVLDGAEQSKKLEEEEAIHRKEIFKEIFDSFEKLGNGIIIQYENGSEKEAMAQLLQQLKDRPLRQQDIDEAEALEADGVKSEEIASDAEENAE